MGAFLVNFHVRTQNKDQVVDVLRQMELEKAWVAGPHGDWVSFWEADASQQHTERIEQLAQRVSHQLEVPVIAFLVHDSDICCYWLYDSGQQLDQYNSYPGYFDGDDSPEEELAADCALLKNYCRPETDVAQLENILAVWTQAQAAEGITPEYVLAEERLSALAPHLGLWQDLVSFDYCTIARTVSLKGISAVWAGIDPAPVMTPEPTPPPKPPALLHDAAAIDDIATIERLVKNGTDVNEIPPGRQQTALAEAAEHGGPETIRRLIALGADIHLHGPEGSSPLHCAIYAGKVANIRTLVELGADIHASVPRVGTMLHLAIQRRLPEVVRVLLELGADVHQRDLYGETPLDTLRREREGMEFMEQQFESARTHPRCIAAKQTLEELQRIVEEAIG